MVDKKKKKTKDEWNQLLQLWSDITQIAKTTNERMDMKYVYELDIRKSHLGISSSCLVRDFGQCRRIYQSIWHAQSPYRIFNINETNTNWFNYFI